MGNAIVDQIEHVISQLTPFVEGVAKTTWSAMVNMRRFESVASLVTDAFGVLVWGSILIGILYAGYRVTKYVWTIKTDNEIDDSGYKALAAAIGAITLGICCLWPGPNLSWNLQGLGDEQLWMGAIAPELSIVHDVYQKVLNKQGS